MDFMTLDGLEVGGMLFDSGNFDFEGEGGSRVISTVAAGIGEPVWLVQLV